MSLSLVECDAKKCITQHHDRAVIGNLLVVNYEQFVHEFQMVGEVGETLYIDDSDGTYRLL